MKLQLITLIVLGLTLSACQQKPAAKSESAPTPNAKPVSPAAPPSGDTTPTRVSSRGECLEKEVVLETDLSTNTTTRTVNETVYRYQTLTLLKSNENGLKKTEVSGESFIEFFKTVDGGTKTSDGKIDYTYSGTRETQTTALGENKFQQLRKISDHRIGRNGYQFTAADGTKSDTKDVTQDMDTTFFNDGEFYYIISQTVNGKANQYINPRRITRGETTGNVTRSVTTYENLQDTELKDSNGAVYYQIAEYEEVCTDEETSN